VAGRRRPSQILSKWFSCQDELPGGIALGPETRTAERRKDVTAGSRTEAVRASVGSKALADGCRGPVNVADISCPESEPVRAPIRSPSSPRDKRGNGRGITLPGSDFEGFVAAGPVGSGARFESIFLRRPVRDIRSESEGDILEGRVSRDDVLPPVSRPPRGGGSQRVIGQAAAAVRPTERGVPGPASPGPRPLRGEPGGGGRGGDRDYSVA
jgi:hypothetical protein